MRDRMIGSYLPEKRGPVKKKIIILSDVYTTLQYLTVFDSSTVCDQDSNLAGDRFCLAGHSGHNWGNLIENKISKKWPFIWQYFTLFYSILHILRDY